MAVAPVQHQRVITRAEFLHAHQPLAVAAEAEAGGISGEIGILVSVEQRAATVMPVEGPELVDRVIVALAGILLDAKLTIR